MMQVSEAVFIINFLYYSKNYICLSAEGLLKHKSKNNGYVGFCPISCGRDARARRHLKCKYAE